MEQLIVITNVQVQRKGQDDLIAQIADKLVEIQNAEDSTLPVLRKHLADTNRSIENMLNTIQEGILTTSKKDRLEQLEKMKDDLKVSILQAELERPKYTREDIIGWIKQFKYGDRNNTEYQRQMIDTFLNSIYVFDDYLAFTYNLQKWNAIRLSDGYFYGFRFGFQWLYSTKWTLLFIFLNLLLLFEFFLSLFAIVIFVYLWYKEPGERFYNRVRKFNTIFILLCLLFCHNGYLLNIKFSRCKLKYVYIAPNFIVGCCSFPFKFEIGLCHIRSSPSDILGILWADL